MISGNQPAQAMTYICDLKLFWVVFSLHPQCEPSEGCDSDCVAYLDFTWNLIQLVGHSTFNDEQRRLSFYAAMLLPLRKTMYKDRKAKDVTKGVLSCATQEVKDLFHLLEHEFLPLDLAVKIQPLLTKISKFGGKMALASSVPEVQLSQYVPALEKLGTLRLLQQVSGVYQSMKIEHLSRMIPFYDFSVVEKIYVDAVKHNFIAMKADHMKGVMMFGNLED
ncbi:eukaryotic translation initiation factor 3 subunit A-like [Rosa rugosa]|uniref:eukaryotic translation initiation factor 3 subunit A-like n=1 Tax=Rosa rugosa TaxID=74645 RepID=UPI002B415395|nr:eukaryotic translation initiation factor 3 subunit A-like [Rosa rugosa]XP_062018899.1 eukaryotic translation initiation factor 3 subunit A-like [Rosa rugosa]